MERNFTYTNNKVQQTSPKNIFKLGGAKFIFKKSELLF